MYKYKAVDFSIRPGVRRLYNPNGFAADSRASLLKALKQDVIEKLVPLTHPETSHISLQFLLSVFFVESHSNLNNTPSADLNTVVEDEKYL